MSVSYNPEKILCCIPARYHSTRLPGKCLKDLHGKPVIQHVWERAMECNCIGNIVVLTDCQLVADAVVGFGGQCVVIAEPCTNGTDRITHYLRTLPNIPNTVVNIQGDEPYIDAAVIDICIQNYHNRSVLDDRLVCSTIHYKTQDSYLIASPTKGKLVTDKASNIMYCSRSPIPSTKTGYPQKGREYSIHIGIFVFKTDYLLKHYADENTSAQMCEDIEWLKIIEQGFNVNTIEVVSQPRGVDTTEDLEYLRSLPPYFSTVISVWIGNDLSNVGQRLANVVCKRSLLTHSPKTIVRDLVRAELIQAGSFGRPHDSTGSTEFTYTRFLVPHLCGYQGIAVFCDNDFLWRSDVLKLVHDHYDPSKAIMCVKHEYLACPSATKMNGLKQEWYPRKNWSSLMIFNCAHPSVARLTPETIATRSSAWLHQFAWCDDTDIGAIPVTYNHLVGYYTDDNPRAVHFTDGGPWHNEYQDVDYADEWRTYLDGGEQRDLTMALVSI